MDQQAQITEMEQGGKLLFPLLIVGGVLLWLGMRKKEEEKPPPGNGLPVGGAQVGGTISIASVSQAVQKLPGSMIRIDGSFTGTTALKSAPNTPIDWPYRIIARIGHSTAFGWRTGDTWFPELSPSTTTWQATKGTVTFSKFFPTPDDPNQEWDIHIELLAQDDANQDGSPDGTWRSLGEAKKDGAIISLPPAPTGAQIGGSISISSVTQKRNLLISRR